MPNLTGAQTAAQLLDQAHATLQAANSPAREVTAALRLAHSTDPAHGLRTVLRNNIGGAR